MIANKIRAAFNAVNQRNTRPRQLITEELVALAASKDDFTIEDLWQQLRKVQPGLGRATVYRSVETLVNASLLDRIEFADGTHHYRICGDRHHHHLTCTHCHHILDIDACLPSDLLTTISEQTGFVIEDHSLALFGCCPSCQTQ